MASATNEPQATSEMRRSTLVECLGPYVRRKMTEDHPRLTRTLEDVAHLANRRSFQSAAQRFGEFRLAEEHHLDFEDKTLIPLVERLAGPSEAAEGAKAELEDIRRLLDAVGQALSSWSLPDFQSAHPQLTRALVRHWDREEALWGSSINALDKRTLEEIVDVLRRC